MGQTKVLIVEDEFTLYDELYELMTDKGFSVVQQKENMAVDNYEDAVELLHQHRPNLAIVDIRLRGERDGLDLTEYIRAHFNMPVIILSAYDNDQNIERVKKIKPDHFVIKQGKPVNKKQLWITIEMLKDKIIDPSPLNTLGKYMKVREVDVEPEKNATSVIRPEDPLDFETFVRWAEISHIQTINKEERNKVRLYRDQPNKAYHSRATMDEMEETLPRQFVRISQSTIVNAAFVTGRRKKYSCIVGDLYFEFSESYQEAAYKKLMQLLGW